MTWVETIPAFLVAIVLIFGPGLLWGSILGLRRLTLLAVAGPFSVTAMVVAAELGSLAGLPWAWPVLLAVTVLVAAALWLLRRLMWNRLHRQHAAAAAPAGWRTVLITWAVSALPLAAYIFWIVGAPENIAQSHDNIFHLNAIRYIADTSNASSLDLGYLGATDGGVFYPAGWHAVVSLVMITSGVPVPVAINVTNLVVVTGIWSTGCLFLVSRLTGERMMPLLVAAVLSTAYSSFPYLLLEFGVVYPFMLSIAMLPVALGLVVQLLRIGLPATISVEGNLVLLAGLLPGLGLAHPATVMGLLALAAPMVIAAAYGLYRHGDHRDRRSAALGTVAYLVVGGILWALLRPARSASDNWDNLGNVLRSLYEVAVHAPLYRPMAILVTVLTIVGIAVVLNVRKHRWAIGVYLVAAVLFVVGNWKEAPELRWLVAGIWYNDFFRISAMLPVANLLIAALGGVALAGTARSFFRAWLARRDKKQPPWLRPVAAAVLTIAALAVAPLFAAQRSIEEAAFKYRFTDSSFLLTTDELALIKRIPQHVPEDAVIAGNPMTGASLSYSYTDRPTLVPSGEESPTAEGKLIMEHLDELESDPAVCQAVLEEGVQYVLDFGNKSVHPGETSTAPGLQDLTEANGFELVDAEGEAALYRITGCS
ncbi:hypothetical protein D477_020713 [Arthrobacter crystallopoietes BAB-32]|uniref:Uncharacterized protein n=1 Tax=Arthrobacter crystallopoietes BAB-32 TaxID=1246476 RepID=N1V275_9MICC|nr:DUF6541 family protein [Arthrobacter crystallopoietes]EMY32328.1 hypothetical protein D477_020713 [Arthrobacter crystallopoietes BAB-32]